MTSKTNTEIFLYSTPEGKVRVETVLFEESLWLSQKRMAELFGVDVTTINEHIKNIYKTHELDEFSTIGKFPIVQIEGSREVTRQTNFYNLDVIISVGYLINSPKVTQFRKWATATLREFIIKGFILDDDRMKKQKKLVPELRFHEFSNAWDETKFGETFGWIRTNNLSRANLTNRPTEIQNIHYGDIHKKLPTLFVQSDDLVSFVNTDNISFINLTDFIKTGDIVIADASEDYADIGKTIEITATSQRALVGGLHTYVARPKAPVATGFLGFFFQSELVRLQIRKMAQGISVLGISKSNLEKIEMKIPKSDEQKKIADFLGAVDKKINLLRKKRELLERYKRGLMQKLFSQELRFRQDDGSAFPDWCNTKLGDVTIWRSGGTPSKKVAEFWRGTIPWVSAISMHYPRVSSSKSNITLEAVKSGSRLAEVGTILLLVRGSMLFKRIPVCIVEKLVAFNQDVKSIEVAPPLNSLFLFYWLTAAENRLLSMVTGTGIGAGKLDMTDLKRLTIGVPSTEEQNKLSASAEYIDQKIVLIEKKLRTATRLKKSLLQKLFI